MEAFVNISKDTIPAQYLTDPLPNIQVEYGCKLFTKSAPDEKEISQVFISKESSDARVGWLVPVLSMISLEHEMSEDKYFRKHVYEAFKILEGREIYEKCYVLIYSKRLMAANDIAEDGELSLSFLSYGIYPYYMDVSAYVAFSTRTLDRATVVDKCFNTDSSVGFFQVLVKTIMPSEMNDYARFMFFYQVYELAMEVVFYKKVRALKSNKSHLGIIRKKMEEYSSEEKLINALYDDMKRNNFDVDLSDVVRDIFEGARDELYYTTTARSNMLYHVRNTLVHSYYRFKVSDKLAYLASYIENEFFYIIRHLYSDSVVRAELEEEYFCSL